MWYIIGKLFKNVLIQTWYFNYKKPKRLPNYYLNISICISLGNNKIPLMELKCKINLIIIITSIILILL